MSCAAALSVINRIDGALLDDVKKKSEYVFSSLRGAKGVERVDGLGLMIGIKTTREASCVVAECIGRGVLCLTAKDKIRLLPALNIPFEALEKAVTIIKEVCEKE